MDNALTVLLPVTRPWALDAVCAAIAASDIPRERAIVYLDAPGCEPWVPALEGLGFEVDVVRAVMLMDPANDRIGRRRGHAAMRQITQGLVPDGPLLCLEDDSIVPPDVYARLSAIGPTATGVQRGRYDRRLGLWVRGKNPVALGSGVEQIDACGLYCLFTTGEAYRAPFAVTDAFGGAVDAAQTAPMRPKVDWELIVGHLTREEIIVPVRKVAEHGSGMAMFADIPLPARATPPPEVYRVATNERVVMAPQNVFRTLRRVVRDGYVQAGPKQLIPLHKAIAWGLCDESGNPLSTADYEGTGATPYVPAGLERPVDPTPPETKDDGDSAEEAADQGATAPAKAAKPAKTSKTSPTAKKAGSEAQTASRKRAPKK